MKSKEWRKREEKNEMSKTTDNLLGYLVVEVVVDNDGASFMLFLRIKRIYYYLFGTFDFGSAKRTS